jgi:hypothetical protein
MPEYAPSPDTAFIAEVSGDPVCLRNIAAPKDMAAVDSELHAEELAKAYVDDVLIDGEVASIFKCRVVGCAALCSVNNTSGKPVVGPVKFSEYSVSLENCHYDSRF